MSKVFKSKILKIDQRKVFWFSITFTVLLFAIYIFSVNATVFNTAKRVKMEKEITLLSHKISEMEFNVIEQKNNINLELAYAMGFEEAKDVKFIPRKSVAVALGDTGIQ